MFWRKPKPEMWEYLQVPEQHCDLDSCGRNGWELVAAIYKTIGEDRQRVVFYLKRPLRSEGK